MNSRKTYQVCIARPDPDDAYALSQLLRCYSKTYLDEVDLNGNSALLMAAFSGSPRSVSALLSAGANFKQINVLGQNALTLATHAGNAECVRMLLARWSYLDYTESALMPPLCVAAFRGHLELVKMFANLYPSPEHIKTVHGVNALMLAMTGGHHAVELYLGAAHPALWNVPTPHGQTAMKLINQLPKQSRNTHQDAL